MKKFLERDVAIVAKELLGSHLERTFEDGSIALVKIVETEAYDQTDLASHSYKGTTTRNEAMFDEAGHLYVYFTYGMHYCCNVVVGKKGYGAAVLIRGVEPLEGEAEMAKRRVGFSGADLSNGPAKLCQALKIDKALNNHSLVKQPLKLILNKPLDSDEITTSTRVGINQAKNVPWRFYIRSNKYVSKV